MHPNLHDYYPGHCPFWVVYLMYMTFCVRLLVFIVLTNMLLVRVLGSASCNVSMCRNVGIFKYPTAQKPKINSSSRQQAPWIETSVWFAFIFYITVDSLPISWSALKFGVAQEVTVPKYSVQITCFLSSCLSIRSLRTRTILTLCARFEVLIAVLLKIQGFFDASAA